MKWSEQDLRAFGERGWEVHHAKRQLDQLSARHQVRTVVSSCGLGTGIQQWTDIELKNCMQYAEMGLQSGREVALFVPASGAATRMFKDLHPPIPTEVAHQLVKSWKALPFAKDLTQPKGDHVLEQAADLADQMVNRLKLDQLPKGAVPFFKRTDGHSITAFESHREEWLQLMGTEMVFTVPESFLKDLPVNYSSWKHVSWEVQHPATDTLSWDTATESLERDPSGSLVFRRGGHGALLENLNALPCDTGLIRNIDNALDGEEQVARVRWQRALLGALWQLEDERKVLWKQLSREEPGAADLAWTWLSPFLMDCEMPKTLEQWHYHLNRPMRVAGVVPNAGQPGGGPFWILDGDGFVRPGIAEKSELPEGFLEKGTHFNPVDLAVSLRGLEDERLILSDFSDSEAFFTTEKEINGRRLRILEHPGLWNGGMANWLTRFVELPGTTFAPVKSVFDLVK